MFFFNDWLLLNDYESLKAMRETRHKYMKEDKKRRA
jgi:hypothetical protein